MALMHTPAAKSGSKPSPFSLKGVDGKVWTLQDAAGPKGVLIMFICNHCPYVKAIISRLVTDAKALQAAGIGVIAVMPNDTTLSPSDSFARMQDFAQEHDFTFPYVIDETQETARAYGAVCTPDFFGYNAEGALQYRGRLDAVNPSIPATPDMPHELRDAMLQVAETGTAPAVQKPSMGCSIKWRKSDAA